MRHLMLSAKQLKPVRFYPYTSCVIHRIAEQSFGYKTKEHDFLEELCSEVKKLALQSDSIKWDNKVVVECEIMSKIENRNVVNSNIFIGRYDGQWHLGLGVYSDSWITPIEIE